MASKRRGHWHKDKECPANQHRQQDGKDQGYSVFMTYSPDSTEDQDIDNGKFTGVTLAGETYMLDTFEGKFLGDTGGAAVTLGLAQDPVVRLPEVEQV